MGWVHAGGLELLLAGRPSDLSLPALPPHRELPEAAWCDAAAGGAVWADRRRADHQPQERRRQRGRRRARGLGEARLSRSSLVGKLQVFTNLSPCNTPVPPPANLLSPTSIGTCRQSSSFWGDRWVCNSSMSGAQTGSPGDKRQARWLGWKEEGAGPIGAPCSAGRCVHESARRASAVEKQRGASISRGQRASARAAEERRAGEGALSA